MPQERQYLMWKVKMNFNDWMNTTPDDEKDTLCLIDAWKAGASAMFLGLIKVGLIKDESENEDE